jgi:hypothetical protein
LNLSKNKLLSGFLNKSLETSPSKYWNKFLSQSAKINSKKFFSKECELVFCVLTFLKLH